MGGGEITSNNYGLNKNDSILELPYFDEKSFNPVHPYHTYAERLSDNKAKTANAGLTSFTYFKKGADGYYASDSTTNAIRTNAAYRLAGAEVKQPIQFGASTEEKYDNASFAFAGNPFMTSISFEALAIQNASRIKSSYQVWAGTGYTGYSAEGDWGLINPFNTLSAAIISPMQSFIVEKSDDISNNETLVFNLPAISNAAITGTGALRSSGNTVDKLDIIAGNNEASVLAFIANREGGQSAFGDLDARKMQDDLSEIPDVYTMKKSDGGQSVPVGVNIISSNDQLIPIGLATAYSGEMSFTFKGMDNYNAVIRFIDTDKGFETDITGKISYRYDFDFTPAINDKNEAIASEGRFFIQLAPATPTSIMETTPASFTVYSKNRAIHVIGNASGLIQQIFVYNTQGQLIYGNTAVNAPLYAIPDTKEAAGIYMVKVVGEKETKNFKILKQ
jgi:hypothetical protein